MSRAGKCDFCYAWSDDLEVKGGTGGWEWCGFCGCGPAEPKHVEALPICPACVGSIGGAFGGPDVPYRPTLKGEACGAADCQGAPHRCPDSGLTTEEESWGPEGDEEEES